MKKRRTFTQGKRQLKAHAIKWTEENTNDIVIEYDGQSWKENLSQSLMRFEEKIKIYTILPPMPMVPLFNGRISMLRLKQEQFVMD